MEFSRPQDSCPGKAGGAAPRPGAGPREALERALEQGRVQRQPCALAVLELDGFLPSLEARGWEAGAEPLLSAVERRLKERVEAGGGWVARYGRESFLLVWPGLGPEAALSRLEEIRRGATAPISVIGPGGRVEAPLAFSAGVATFPRDAQEASELLCLARDAAAVARGQGGGRSLLAPQRPMKLKTTYYPPGQLETLGRLGARLGRTEASLLREALEELLRAYGQ